MVNDRADNQGTVQWIDLTSTGQADNIVADYLILCASPFFEPNNPNSEVLRIANHRANYNGFDAPIEQTMYLGPLRDHNLLQAVARTNRPYNDKVTKLSKEFGQIVDYVGVFQNYK